MKQQFIELLRTTNRIGIEGLIQHLEQNGFFTQPASAGNHLCTPGGLLEHSLNVCKIASKMHLVISSEERIIPTDSVIIASLLHDVGKMGFEGNLGYVDNILKSKKISTSKPYKKNENLIQMEHQDLSLLIVSQFIKLTEDEMIAIKYHNGLYTPDGRDIKNNETPLMLLIHFADMWAANVIEKE